MSLTKAKYRMIDAAFVNLDDFGADPNGVSDSTSAIQSAFVEASTLNKTIYGNGTYKCSSRLVLPAVSIDGNIVLDMSSVISPISSYVTIGDQSHTLLTTVASTTNFNTFVVADATGISVGDVLLLSDQTNSSWNAARLTYKSGEIVEVASISGTSITTTKPRFASYSTSTNVYKFASNPSVVISGFSVIPSGTETVASIRFQNLKNSVVKNINISGNTYTNIQAANCYEVTFENIKAQSIHSALSSDDYAFRIVDSQSIRCLNLDLTAPRHAFTTSATGGEHTIVTRNVWVENCTISTLTDENNACDFHGNSQFYYVTNNKINGGVIIRGADGSITNNEFVSTTQTGNPVFYFAELKSINHTVSNNRVIYKGSVVDATRGYIFDCSGNSSELDANTDIDGTLLISSNKVIVQASTGSSSNFMEIANRGSTADNKIVIQDNYFEVNTSDISSSRIYHVSGTPFSLVYEKNNTFINVSLRVEGISGSELPDLRFLGGTTYKGGTDSQLTVLYADRVIITGQSFTDSPKNSIYLDIKDAAQTTAEVYMSNLTVLDYLVDGATGVANTDSGIFVNQAKTVQINACTIGTDNAAQQYRYRVTNVNTFVVGNNYTFGSGTDSTSGITSTISI